MNAQSATRSRAVYVVDDDSRFLDSLICLLEAADWTPLSFRSADFFLQEARSLYPAPLLLDVRMPGTQGLDLLQLHQFIAEKFAVIMLTGHGDIEMAVRALKAGAIDFLEKPFRLERLLDVLEGAEKELLRRTRHSVAHQGQDLVAALSPRERQVLRGVAEGKVNKIIAYDLGLSVRTVEMHRANAMAKLGVRTTAGLLKIALEASYSLES